MARAARRNLTPSPKYADPLAAGIGGFTGSLNQALIRMQNAKNARDLKAAEGKSSLDRAIELLGQKHKDDLENIDERGKQQRTAQAQKEKTKNPPIGNLDDLFKNDNKTYQKYVASAHAHWQDLQKNAYTIPELSQKLSATQDPNEQKGIMKEYFKTTNPDDANILSHAANHLIGGQDQSAQSNVASQPFFSLTAPPTGFTMPSGPATGQ